MKMAAADNQEEVKAVTLKQHDDDRDTPADPPTNPEPKVKETYDTEMPTPAVTLPESDRSGEVGVPEDPDDGKHDNNAEINASPSSADLKKEVKIKIKQEAWWRGAGKVMSDFDGDSVVQAADEIIRSTGKWRHIVKHIAALQSLYLAALQGFPAYNQPSIACVTETYSELTRCLNALGQNLFPSVHWMCIQVIRRGKGTDPMLPHRHKNDESTLSAIVCFGEFSGREFLSQGIISSGHQPAPVCTFHEGQPVNSVAVDPRRGVIFNSHCPHCPLPWHGDGISVIYFSAVAWRCLTRLQEQTLSDLGFPT